MHNENRNRRRSCLALLLAAATAPAAAQLIGQGGGLGGIVEPVGGAIDDTLDRVGDIVEPIEEELDERVDELEQTAETTLDNIDRLAAEATDIFLADDDPTGRSIERDIWVVLVPGEFSNQIPGWGFNVRERQDLEGLDLIMLRIEAPDDRGMTETEQQLNDDAPGTVVDFNHVYGATQADPAESLTGRASVEPDTRTDVLPPGALTLGLIDSAITASHEAFANVAIVQQDFVPFQGERPRAHGTAVASIAFDALRARNAERPLAVIAASVFFAADGSDQIATTGSLVAALEWLGNRDVSVINMSLAGPPNRVLEAALGAIARRGAVVVAAVGNDGPAGEALYPAAYDSVIGITAVDDDRRVYRRANRGPQVAFAALGVRVRAARPEGDFRRETGTSMAAPVAAAVIASELAIGDINTEDVLRRLERDAIDLGDAGFDDVYGHGLITPVE
jgi:subtilisin family serine protease